MKRFALFFVLFPSFVCAAQQNLLLITIDTLRADRLGAYGYRTAKTPNLDRLAKESLFFENAFCHAPLTLPSHTSLLTGKYPYKHGVRDNAGSVGASQVTLAEILRGNGYHTYAFVGGFPLDHRFGLNQGFDLYDDRFPREPGSTLNFRSERPAPAVMDAVASQKLRQPFFLWVHFYDPHAPYLNGGYDGEISAVDQQVGRLLNTVPMQNTIVAVAGDHGESLGEHGELTHRIFIYDSTMRVPFFIRIPGADAKKIASNAQLVDFLPIVLHQMKIPVPSGIDGKLPSSPAADRPVYLESLFPNLELGWSSLIGIRTAEWKYIQAPKEELYNLRADPNEQRNVAANHASVIQKLRKQLPPSTTAGKSQPISAETAEQLAALGYVSGGNPQGSSSSIDPKDRIQIWNDIERAVDFERTRPAEAVAILEKTRRKDPENPMVLSFLAQKYTEQNRIAEAKKILQIALQRHPRNVLALYRLGALQLKSGQPQEALRTTARLRKQEENNLDAVLLSARANLSVGRLPAAIQDLRTGLKIDPEDLSTRVDLGTAYFENKQITQARTEFSTVLKADATNVSALNGMAMCAFVSGDYNESERLLKMARARQPVDPQTLMNTALLYSKTGRAADAIAFYQKVVQLKDVPAQWRKQAQQRIEELQE